MISQITLKNSLYSPASWKAITLATAIAEYTVGSILAILAAYRTLLDCDRCILLILLLMLLFLFVFLLVFMLLCKLLI